MYENYKQQIHGAIFIACTIFALISPSYNTTIVQAETGKANTGKVETRLDAPVSNSGETNQEKNLRGFKYSSKLEDGKTNGFSSKDTVSNSGKMERGVEYKIDKLIEVGIIPEIAESLVTNCKALADNPVRCIKIGAFIVVNESSGGKSCKKSNQYNCFGLSVKENYKSYNDGVLHFVGKYNRFWLNQTNPNSFYSNSPDWKPVTKFCLSESSSGLPYCKNGHRIAWSVFNKLNKVF